jgi:nicotinamidase-related amidase
MKTLLLLLLGLFSAATSVAAESSSATRTRTALLIIDIQEFYFPGGAMPLVEPEAAATNAGRLLAAFRGSGDPVIHVRHAFEPGGSIHAAVAPDEGEMVFTKTQVSCFNGTDLLAHLRELDVEHLVIAGMQTHMCVEAATRAAYDLGFQCTVIEDACATRDLSFGGRTVAAADVHASTLATLHRSYARITDLASFLGEWME